MPEQQPPSQHVPQQPYPQQPYPQQPYPPTPYGVQPPPGFYPPPRKDHTLRNVLLVLLGLGILVVGGCAVMVGAFVNEVGESLESELTKDKPVVVTEGEAFERDGFEAAAGWRLAPTDFGSVTIKRLEVSLPEDEGNRGRTARFSFRFYEGNRIVNELDCLSHEMLPGETSAMNCESFTAGGDYDTIKVAASW